MRKEVYLKRRRKAAERLMVDKCTISRETGESVFNPQTGGYDTVSAPVYSGKCKVQSQRSTAATPEAGEAQFTVVRREVHVPAGTDVQDGDLIEITESELTPVLVDRVFRVEGFVPDSFDTAFRLPVEVYT
ncbi:DUF6093 family protein [Arthrobacter sp. D2-10]